MVMASGILCSASGHQVVMNRRAAQSPTMYLRTLLSSRLDAGVYSLDGLSARRFPLQRSYKKHLVLVNGAELGCPSHDLSKELCICVCPQLCWRT